jgi:two-component system nitrogen regulation response regulator GlnG
MPTPTDTQTQDTSRPDGWARRDAPAGEAQKPRLRLLFHPDLSRVGAVALDGLDAPGAWLAVGRQHPRWTAPGGAGGPLEDPLVSRAQLRVRFRPELGLFEVEPVADARRALARLELDDGPARTVPLTATALLPPGTCVAIGDRALLALELGRHRHPESDRLGMVGEGEAMWALRDELWSVSRFGRPVLIQGETGAGKELVAHALHRLSDRRAGPFVPVNCGALPEALGESALFGHRRGAFTGATADEKGLFRAADGGTLVLDEVGELSLPLQAKLLRVLQEGVVVPVGAQEGQRVDVRVVAATHRDLGAQVKAGRLREDLYHRLAAHVVQVPSLRARRLDVPELFIHALGKLRAVHRELDWLWSEGLDWRPALPIGFVAALLQRPWSGNVRELQNVAERCARLNLTPGDFHPPELFEPLAALAAPPRPPTPAGPIEAPVQLASERLGLAPRTVVKLLPPPVLAALHQEAERQQLPAEAQVQALRARAAQALLGLLEPQDFNQSNVAQSLGVSRTTLIKLMDDLGLPRAADLTADQIAQACAAAGGDLEAAARGLRVSVTALKKRLTLLNLGGPR